MAQISAIIAKCDFLKLYFINPGGDGSWVFSLAFSTIIALTKQFKVEG